MKNYGIIGKWYVIYTPQNFGVNIHETGKVTKYTDFPEIKDKRFSPKFATFKTKKEAIDFIYQEKKTISLSDAKEFFNDSFLEI